MPRPRKPTPLKHCKNCGKKMERQEFNGRLEDLSQFRKRVFCNRRCMAEAREGTIKVLNNRNSHRQSCKAVKGSCEICGASKRMLHVHHKDGNGLNNSDENLITLCVPCHRRSHSPNYTDMGRKRKSCKLCDQASYRKQLCGMHLQRLKKHGSPYLTKRRIGSSYVLVDERE